MSEIVKTCKKHGDLRIDQVYEERFKNTPTFRLRCKKCRRDYEIENRDKRLAYSREYEKTKRKRPTDYYEKHVKPNAREWRRKNADLVNSRVAKDRELNPEKYREYDRKWRMNNLIYARELDVIRKHDISYDEYVWMLNKQEGKCYICCKEETKKSRTEGQVCRLAIDHNHETGKVRKLLCHNCNILIGYSRESIEILEKTIQYLKEHAG